jgi:hypothetical protein
MLGIRFQDVSKYRIGLGLGLGQGRILVGPARSGRSVGLDDGDELLTK